jgi:hypothetical protein
MAVPPNLALLTPKLRDLLSRFGNQQDKADFQAVYDAFRANILIKFCRDNNEFTSFVEGLKLTERHQNRVLNMGSTDYQHVEDIGWFYTTFLDIVRATVNGFEGYMLGVLYSNSSWSPRWWLKRDLLNKLSSSQLVRTAITALGRYAGLKDLLLDICVQAVDAVLLSLPKLLQTTTPGGPLSKPDIERAGTLLRPKIEQAFNQENVDEWIITTCVILRMLEYIELNSY